MAGPGDKSAEPRRAGGGAAAPEKPAACPGGRLEQAVRAHGQTAMAWLTLKANLNVWPDSALQSSEPGSVAYRDTGGAWVAAGDPLVAAEHAAACTGHFFRAAARAGRRASIFASEQSGELPAGQARLRIGRQPVLDPTRWAETIAGSRTLRQQLRRAARKGVRTHRLGPAELLEPRGPWPTALRALEQRWLAHKSLPPLGFVVKLETPLRPEMRCLVVARAGEQLVGLSALSPIPAGNGYLLEELMRDPSAPNGTAEALVDAALRAAVERGAGSVTLGLAPLSGVDDRGLRLARRLGEGLYRFSGLERFKAKFCPAAWQPVYIVRPAGQGRYWAVHDCLLAFAEGSFLRYGVQAALRGPPLVLRALGVLLWPWMALLILAPDRWYPGASFRWFWLGFDVLLSFGLLALSYRFQPWLARSLLTLLGFDVLATWLLATLYNARQLRSVGEAAVLAIACVSPLLALLAVKSALERDAICRPEHAPRVPAGSWPEPQHSPASGAGLDSGALRPR